MSHDRCPTCSRRVVEITIEADGKPLTMRSCSNCDTREWTRSSDPVALDGVLDELASPR